MTFYEKFLQLCKEKNVKPSMVAQAIGLSNSSATYWKRGAIPKLETIKKIAAYFEVPVTDFFNESVVNQTGLSAEGDLPELDEKTKEYRTGILEEDLYFRFLDTFLNALEESEERFLSLSKGIPDDVLRREAFQGFKYLNRLGKLMAVKAIYQLNENPKYRE